MSPDRTKQMSTVVKVKKNHSKTGNLTEELDLCVELDLFIRIYARAQLTSVDQCPGTIVNTQSTHALYTRFVCACICLLVVGLSLGNLICK